ncbi:MAG: hypothetical protein KGL12_13985 [Rhodospirillales bacterium]|nr:hypothetical protein [Rhodospirillales bacterium]
MKVETKFTLAVFVLAALWLLASVPAPGFILESDDQGYQMALGAAVAAGHLPGFQAITQYGPFVAFASWIALVLSGNAGGEMVLDALGYAAAIALAARLIARDGGRGLAMLGALALLALFPRYYKWYYWLLPLLGLGFARAWQAGARGPAMLLGWGASVGMACLFRYDLGVQGVVFGAIAIAAADWAHHRRLLGRRIGLFVAASAVLPVGYVGLITLASGTAQAGLFLHSIVSGFVDTVEYYRIAPLPAAEGIGGSAAWFLSLAQIGVPLTEAAACLPGLLQWRRDGGMDRRGYALFTAGLAGLGVFPQALHRAEIQHLLQVIPPFVIALALLIAAAWRARARLDGLALAAMVLIMALARPGAGMDLGSPWRNQPRLWHAIAALPASRPQEPLAALALAIRRLTPPGARVFLMLSPTPMPLPFFARRAQPGLFPTYEPGMFAGPVWRAANCAALLRHPPDFLVVAVHPAAYEPPAYAALGIPALPAPFIPGLIAAWTRRYTRVLYENGTYRLLAPTEAASAPLSCSAILAVGAHAASDPAAQNGKPE